MKRRYGSRATTLIELIVVCGILGFVMTAVISFYIEAGAVSAKRHEASERLRRFHVGLDKIEQALREGRLVQMSSFRLTLLNLTTLAEEDGMPNFSPSPLQFISRKDGVHQLNGNEDKVILPFKPGERMIFAWLPELPGAPQPIQNTLLSVELHYSGAEDGRSDLLFRRTLNLDYYYGQK